VIPIALVAVLTLASRAEVTPESIGSLVQKRPAYRVVSDLFGDSQTWSAIEAGIASGDRRWLEVAAHLYASCDAGICYALKMALGEALLTNPSGVLAVAGDGYSAGDACSTYGYLTDSTDVSLPKALAAIRARQEAVRAVKDRSLAARRQECLTELRGLKAYAPKAFK